MGSFQDKIATALISRIRERRNSASAPALGKSNSGKVPPATLREAVFSDFSGVAKLKERAGIVADSLENWNRLWRDNPAIAEGGIKRAIGWVLEADGEIVGYLGNISLQCRYGEKRLTAVATHGFATDPRYRSLAISLAAAFYGQKSVDLFITSSAVESSGRIALAFRCSALPHPDYDTVLFWVLRPYRFARVIMNKLQMGRLVALIGAIFTSWAIAADTLFSRRWPRRSVESLAVVESGLDAIGEDFQALWTERFLERPRLYADRSPAVLRWHFAIPGDRGSVCVLSCRKEGRLEGYAVVRSDTDPRDGLSKSIIADMVVRQDDQAVLTALSRAAYRYARRAGSDVFEVQGFPPEVTSIPSAWAPYRRRLPACPYFYKAADPVLHKALNDPATWYACPFDGDSSLIRPSYSSFVQSTLQQQPKTEQAIVSVPVPES